LKILVDIGHPSHIHLFKNSLRNFVSHGHEVKIVARDKDVTKDLLIAYSFEYEIIGKSHTSFIKKVINLPKVEFELYSVAKKFKPDILLGASGNFYVAHVGRILKVPSIIFEDSEPDSAFRWLCAPFATYICTPELFELDFGYKQLRYNGYKELAYLHPDNFTPDSSILELENLDPDENFILFRFVGWNAAHDISQNGLNLEQKIQFVKSMANYCKVYISSEAELPAELNEMRLTIPSHNLHDILSYATMLVTDGQTMATEASILGIPTIRVNSFVGSMSNFKELEQKYDLMYSFRDFDSALKKAIDLYGIPNLKEIWSIKRRKLLQDKIDVTSLIIYLIEEYPYSFVNYSMNSKTEKISKK
jgi:predicted glycosyltransferase